MRRQALLTAALLAALALSNAAPAEAVDCPPPGTTPVSTTTVIGGTTISVYTGSSYTPPPDTAAAGVCVDLNGQLANGGNRFDGGSLEAGVDVNDGVVPDPIDAIDTTPQNFPPQIVDGGQILCPLTVCVPGVYLIADGDPNNADPTGASSGYIGLSNWETATPDADCDGVDEAANGGTNSGGCVTVNHPVNGTPLLALPIPLLVGGSATGPYDGSSRDGLSVP